MEIQRTEYKKLSIDNMKVVDYYMGISFHKCCFCKVSLNGKRVFSQYRSVPNWDSHKEAHNKKLNNSFCDKCYEKLYFLAGL